MPRRTAPRQTDRGTRLAGVVASRACESVNCAPGDESPAAGDAAQPGGVTGTQRFESRSHTAPPSTAPPQTASGALP